MSYPGVTRDILLPSVIYEMSLSLYSTRNLTFTPSRNPDHL